MEKAIRQDDFLYVVLPSNMYTFIASCLTLQNCNDARNECHIFLLFSNQSFRVGR